jgi:hypothetical protein
MLEAGDYSNLELTDVTRDKIFIERIEAIITMEGTKYFSLRQKSEPSKKQA